MARIRHVSELEEAIMLFVKMEEKTAPSH